MNQIDSENIKNGKPDIYDSVNVIIRRKGRVCENPRLSFSSPINPCFS